MVEIVKSINDLSLHFNFPHIVYETLLNYMLDEQVRREEAERQTEITGGGWKGSRESVPRLSPHPPSTLPYLFHPLVFFC